MTITVIVLICDTSVSKFKIEHQLFDLLFSKKNVLVDIIRILACFGLQL